MPGTGRYVGRFAPSPTGPLHAGSLVAALASWLDARAHGGRWLVRIEDVDTPRCVPGADAEILRQLAAVDLRPDEPPVWQSRRGALYKAALQRLAAEGWAYPCGCTRRDVELALAQQGMPRSRHGELVYPGTCRPGHGGLKGKAPRSMRLAAANLPADRMDAAAPLVVDWHDRRLGSQRQDVTHEVGDFVLRRADGLWAYQLAVVVDDAEQGVTDVVRGADLADNTPRQIHLQRCLHVPAPRYLHAPLVLGDDGEKLSKQNGAQPLALDDPLATLQAAGRTLALPPLDAATPVQWLQGAVQAWRAAYAP